MSVWLLEAIDNPGTSNSDTVMKDDTEVAYNNLSYWKQRPQCYYHVMDVMDNTLPRSLRLAFFIWMKDYSKALAWWRCSREDHKPHMVQKSSGRSAVRVLEISRSRQLHMAGDSVILPWLDCLFTIKSSQFNFLPIRSREATAQVHWKHLLLWVNIVLWCSPKKQEKGSWAQFVFLDFNFQSLSRRVLNYF